MNRRFLVYETNEDDRTPPLSGADHGRKLRWKQVCFLDIVAMCAPACRVKSAPKSREQLVEESEQKLRAISELMSCPAFVNFYLPMLRARGEEHDQAALKTAGLALEEREVRRRIGREYDEIVVAHEKAAALARGTIAANR